MPGSERAGGESGEGFSRSIKPVRAHSAVASKPLRGASSPCSPYAVMDAYTSRALSGARSAQRDRKSTRLNSSHSQISYAVFCLKKKKKRIKRNAAHALGQLWWES